MSFLRLLSAALSTALLAPAAVAAQEACPRASGPDAEAGWEAYRAGDMARARARFESALARCPDDLYAATGLGYVALREGGDEEARGLFTRVVAARPDEVDALVGLGLVAWRAGDRDGVRARFLRVRELDPEHPTAREYLARLEEAPALAAGPDDEADEAWRAGDTRRAVALYEARLQADPGDAVALHRLALARAWDERYDEALRLLERVVALEPDNLDARLDGARVRAWRGDVGEALDSVDAVLADHPGHPAALAARARLETWTGRYEASLSTYDQLLAIAPEDVGALQGTGRALSWSGRLVEGEEAFRRAVAADPTDVASLVGLAQSLRWQGRNAAALDVLEQAARLDPTDGDVREQRRWVDVALGARVGPTVALEGDSDDNRMLTASVMASWHPHPRLGLRADAYRRTLDQGALSRTATGLTLSGSWQADPGWTLSAGVGGSRTDGSGPDRFTAWSLGVGSPGRYPVGVTVTATSSALDATALLAERGVEVTEVAATGQWTPAPAWRVDASAGRAAFHGSDTNHRTSLSVAASRRLARVWWLGAGVRGFAFGKDLTDGYFDPDFYGIAEVTGRWLHEPDRWSFLLEVAPGVQQVGEDGDPAVALRASARVALRLAPGREVSVAAGSSSAGLQSFSTGASDYRYAALIVGGSWVF